MSHNINEKNPIEQLIDSAPLPQYPEPTRATAEQTAEINAAVKAGRIVFEPGWNDPAPDTPPLPALTLSDERVEMWINGIGGGIWTDGKLCLRRDELAAVIRGIAALAVRQAPQPKLILSLPDYEKRQIVIASDEVIDGERIVCIAIKDQ